MIYGDSLRSCCVAIIVPHLHKVKHWATEHGKSLNYLIGNIIRKGCFWHWQGDLGSRFQETYYGWDQPTKQRTQIIESWKTQRLLHL